MKDGNPAMDEKMISYEADLDQEYEALTEKHETKKRQLEAALSQYLEGKNVKPVTIQGPYGSGKTQLLYHLFKFTWENGGIAVYVHLEDLIPTYEMGAAGYAEYLKELVNRETNLLRQGKSQLMAAKVKDYAVDHIRSISSSDSPIVLLIDEIEQQYKTLNGRVKTDDNSPMREVIARVNRGDAGFYLILAFAPVSFYEFSKGEAQTGRFLPIILPMVEPRTFRGIFGYVGNLIWWMGKGRYRGISRTQDIFKSNVPDINRISKKELQDLSRNMGSIGGVPALDSDGIEPLEDFNSFRDFLVHLQPREKGGEMHSGTTKIVKKCRIFENGQDNLSAIVEKSLRGSGVSRLTDIGYYSSIVLDAFSSPDGKLPVFTDPDDWKEFFNVVEDIILEFEGEDNLPAEDLRKLQEDASEFSFNIRSNAASLAALGEGYCITPGFVRVLFPFPISSPSLTNKRIEEQREALGDQTYLGREESDGISVFFFLNQDKIREYLVQESKSFLKETKALFAVNLGEEKEFDMPKLAQWLHKEGRFSITSPPRILSAFLVNFFYWIRNERGENLPVARVLEKLVENQSVPEKDKARKISYYTSRVKEFLANAIPSPAPVKYILRDKTGFGDFRSGRIGFAPEVIGLAFVDSRSDWEATYKFRREFHATTFVRKKSAEKLTGLGTALESAVVEKDRSISVGAVLRRVNGSFSKHLPDLRDVAGEVNSDEFATIPADEDSELIFRGLFLHLREWKDHSKAQERFEEKKSSFGSVMKRVITLSEQIREFEKSTGKQIPLTHNLEGDVTKLKNIEKILSDYRVTISPYTKFLLSTFTEKIIEIVEPQLNETEKRFAEFKGSIRDALERYGAELKNIEAFDKYTFEWIDRSKYEIKKESQKKFKETCQQFTKGGKIDLEKIPDVEGFNESLEELTEELRILGEIDEGVKQCKTKAQAINEKLSKWEME